MANTLKITVNRRRFDARHGVKPAMTAAELAELIDIPARNAIVEREGDNNELFSVPSDAPIDIEPGMHFLVTRHFVMGG